MFGVVTRVLVRLVRAPQAYKTMLGVFESVDDASQTVSDIISAGIVPGALEMMDQLITQAVEAAYHFGFPLDAGAVLIVELDGLTAGLERQAERVIEICKRIAPAKSAWPGRTRTARTSGSAASGPLAPSAIESQFPDAGRCGPAIETAGNHEIHPCLQRKAWIAHTQRVSCR
jgi:FAD/FMN-containing dehydrogenase